MRPFLRTGCSLRYAIEKAALLGHKTAIYDKYNLKDWFSEKVDALRSTVGEMINSVGFRVVEAISTKMVESEGKVQLTSEEVQVWKTMAEKHRAAQPFFVTRTETAESNPEQLGKILDTLEKTDYERLGQQAKGQMVANDAPVQDKGQAGAASDVPAQPNPTPASS